MRKILMTLLCSAALVAASCGGDDGGSAGASGTEGGDRPGEGISFTVGFTGGEKDIGHLAMLEAMERMRDMGYEIEQPYLAETELVTDSVVRGTFQFGVITPPALVAYESGATNIRIVGSRNPNDWAIVGQAAHTRCDDLDGKTFAIHSEGSVMAAIYRKWQADECSDGKSAKEIVISGSPNRAAALMAGEIDATAVQIPDLATLQEEYGESLSVLSKEWERDPELITSSIYVNHDWAQENHQAVTDLLRLMNEVAREWQEDPAAFEEHLRQELPDLDDFYVNYFAHELGARGLYVTNGGIDEQSLQKTIDFFAEGGAIEGTVTATEILDMSYLEAAMKELGVELSVQTEFTE